MKLYDRSRSLVLRDHVNWRRKIKWKEAKILWKWYKTRKWTKTRIIWYQQVSLFSSISINPSVWHKYMDIMYHLLKEVLWCIFKINESSDEGLQ